VWVALAAAARARSWRARGLRLGLVALVSTGVALAVAAPWLELPDSLEPLLTETTAVGYANALPDHLALAIAEHVIGPPDAVGTARELERLLAAGVFGAVLAAQARRVWSAPTARSVVRASVVSSLVYILVAAASVQTWYFALPVALVVLLAVLLLRPAGLFGRVVVRRV
jgi:hypothetical protein